MLFVLLTAPLACRRAQPQEVAPAGSGAREVSLPYPVSGLGNSDQ